MTKNTSKKSKEAVSQSEKIQNGIKLLTFVVLAGYFVFLLTILLPQSSFGSPFDTLLISDAPSNVVVKEGSRHSELTESQTSFEEYNGSFVNADVPLNWQVLEHSEKYTSQITNFGELEEGSFYGVEFFNPGRIKVMEIANVTNDGKDHMCEDIEIFNNTSTDFVDNLATEVNEGRGITVVDNGVDTMFGGTFEGKEFTVTEETIVLGSVNEMDDFLPECGKKFVIDEKEFVVQVYPEANAHLEDLAIMLDSMEIDVVYSE